MRYIYDLEEMLSYGNNHCRQICKQSNGTAITSLCNRIFSNVGVGIASISRSCDCRHLPKETLSQGLLVVSVVVVNTFG